MSATSENPDLIRASLTTVRSALCWASERLRLKFPDPRLDAELLLAFVLGKPRTYLHTWPSIELNERLRSRFQALVERRAAGEPIAYITSHREFWSMELQVTSATLIPRPDTELLVELALQLIPPSAEWCIADLGSGSGAIALALAHERPACQITATDISADALEVARANASRFNLCNIEFCLGNPDWFAPLHERCYHVIVSNPPYVRCFDPHLEQGDPRFEPRSALVAGEDGLEQLRAIAIGARKYLHSTDAGGWLLLEHGFDQGQEMLKCLRELGYQNVQGHTDLAGHPRVVRARYISVTS